MVMEMNKMVHKRTHVRDRLRAEEDVTIVVPPEREEQRGETWALRRARLLLRPVGDPAASDPDPCGPLMGPLRPSIPPRHGY